jgi:hypothetical protein
MEHCYAGCSAFLVKARRAKSPPPAWAADIITSPREEPLAGPPPRGVFVRLQAQETDMKTCLAKTALPEPRKRLIEVLQTLNFGRIEDLLIRDGNPVLDPMPRIVREHKFAGENGARPELDARDFVLKAQVVDLFRLLDDIRDGTIAMLTVKHGLPFHAELPG